MNAEQQLIAIAEALGHRYHKPTEAELKSGSYYQYEPGYLNDLNAMHEAEMTLNRKQCIEYVTELGYVVGNTGVEYYDLIRATAAQRAEAFLRAIGKWV